MWSKIKYLCSYDLYGPVRNAFDAVSIPNESKWEGVGPWKSRLFWALWNGIKPIGKCPWGPKKALLAFLLLLPPPSVTGISASAGIPGVVDIPAIAASLLLLASLLFTASLLLLMLMPCCYWHPCCYWTFLFIASMIAFHAILYNTVYRTLNRSKMSPNRLKTFPWNET